MPSVTFSSIEVGIRQAATTHRSDEMDGINRSQPLWNGMFLGCVPSCRVLYLPSQMFSAALPVMTESLISHFYSFVSSQTTTNVTAFPTST